MALSDEPPLKLHRVIFELEVYVMAVDAKDARDAAQDCLREEMWNTGCSVDNEIPVLAAIPQEIRESIPWGNDDDRTVEEIVSSMQP